MINRLIFCFWDFPHICRSGSLTADCETVRRHNRSAENASSFDPAAATQAVVEDRAAREGAKSDAYLKAVIG